MLDSESQNWRISTHPMQTPDTHATNSEEEPEELFEHLYDDLKNIAKAHMRDQVEGHTLQPTALVNEA